MSIAILIMWLIVLFQMIFTPTGGAHKFVAIIGASYIILSYLMKLIN